MRFFIRTIFCFVFGVLSNAVCSYGQEKTKTRFMESSPYTLSINKHSGEEVANLIRTPISSSLRNGLYEDEGVGYGAMFLSFGYTEERKKEKIYFQHSFSACFGYSRSWYFFDINDSVGIQYKWSSYWAGIASAHRVLLPVKRVGFYVGIEPHISHSILSNGNEFYVLNGRGYDQSKHRFYKSTALTLSLTTGLQFPLFRVCKGYLEWTIGTYTGQFYYQGDYYSYLTPRGWSVGFLWPIGK